jgi:hypothetical protein
MEPSKLPMVDAAGARVLVATVVFGCCWGVKYQNSKKNGHQCGTANTNEKPDTIAHRFR